MLLSALFHRCLTVPYHHVEKGGDYALERAGNALTVYFEDSDGALDWFHNLAFPVGAYRRMGHSAWYAHHGFLRVWRALIPYLESPLRDPTLTAVTVVGYSHGAALATLCHEYVWFHRPDLRAALQGYGFGSPRVLFRPTAEVRVRWERFTVVRNLDDAVTHLPPSFLGYAHVGQLLEVGERGRYTAVDAHRPNAILRELAAWERKNPPLP